MLDINVNIKAPELIEAVQVLTKAVSLMMNATNTLNQAIGDDTEPDEENTIDLSYTITKEEVDEYMSKRANTEPDGEDSPEEPNTEEPQLTLETVRALAAKNNKGAVKELLEKYGVDKLTSIDPKQYGAFYKELEAL